MENYQNHYYPTTKIDLISDLTPLYLTIVIRDQTTALREVCLVKVFSTTSDFHRVLNLIGCLEPEQQD